MGNVLQENVGVTIAKGNKIDLIRIILTIGIVSLHATITDLATSTAAFDLITKVVIIVTKVCVPVFFVMSGYLYFRNTPEDPSSEWFWKKLRSRFFSLFIPYIIANCIALVVYYSTMKVFPSMISGFLGDNWKDPVFVFWKGPVNLSLWFIRELIKVTILTPVIFLIVKHFRWWGVIILGLLLVLKIGPAPLFYYSAGSCLAVWKINPVEKWLMSDSRVKVSSRAWTYFVYLYHYLLIIGIKKSLVAWLNPTETLPQVAIYLATVIGSLIILTITYALMRRIIPKITSVLVGGK